MKIDGFDPALRATAEQSQPDTKTEQPMEQSFSEGIAEIEDAISQEQPWNPSSLDGADHFAIPIPHFGVPQPSESHDEKATELNRNVFIEQNRAAETSHFSSDLLQAQASGDSEINHSAGEGFNLDGADRLGFPIPHFGLPQPSESDDEKAAALNRNVFLEQNRPAETSHFSSDLLQEQESQGSEFNSNTGEGLNLDGADRVGFPIPKFGVPQPSKSDDQPAITFNPNVRTSDEDK